MTTRTATSTRRTGETEVSVAMCLDGSGKINVRTGIGFLDHLVATLAKHARFDLTLSCKGDIEVDDHHTAEDCALALGAAIDQALGTRAGFARFGSAYAPLDEALARAVIDLSGRPCAVIQLGLSRDALGGLACENITHLFVSLANSVRGAIHVDVLRGDNDHHRAEAACKALALALRMALARTGETDVPSTKGAL